MYGDGDGKVWDRVARPHRDCMCYLGPPTTLMPIGMRKSPDVSPRRLSDISPQLRQLKYLVVDEAIKEDLKSSRSVEDINSASIEERILRITGYYGYQPWSASYKSKSPMNRLPLRGNVGPLFQGWGSDSTQAVSPTGNVTVGREVSSTFSTAHHCRHYKNEEGANDWKYMLCWSIYFIVITDWLFHSLDSLDLILANL